MGIKKKIQALQTRGASYFAVFLASTSTFFKVVDKSLNEPLFCDWVNRNLFFIASFLRSARTTFTTLANKVSSPIPNVYTWIDVCVPL